MVDTTKTADQDNSLSAVGMWDTGLDRLAAYVKNPAIDTTDKSNPDNLGLTDRLVYEVAHFSLKDTVTSAFTGNPTPQQIREAANSAAAGVQRAGGNALLQQQAADEVTGYAKEMEKANAWNFNFDWPSFPSFNLDKLPTFPNLNGAQTLLVTAAVLLGLVILAPTIVKTFKR